MASLLNLQAGKEKKCSKYTVSLKKGYFYFLKSLRTLLEEAQIHTYTIWWFSFWAVLDRMRQKKEGRGQ